VGRCELDPSGSFEYGNEPSALVKGGEFLEQLNEY
jgi:hypothetical protein